MPPTCSTAQAARGLKLGGQIPLAGSGAALPRVTASPANWATGPGSPHSRPGQQAQGPQGQSSGTEMYLHPLGSEACFNPSVSLNVQQAVCACFLRRKCRRLYPSTSRGHCQD